MAFSVIKTAAALLIVLLCLFEAWEPKSVTGQRVQQFRAPVPPSGRNPCTNIPGQGHGRCTLEEEVDGDGNNFENSGSSVFMAASVANQTQLEEASVANQTQKNHSLSS